MKRLIIFLLLFAAIKVAGQTTGYLRFDTVKIMKQGGTAELYLINSTKDSLGLLTNIGGGLTRFYKPRVLNDSTFTIGRDTLVIRGGVNTGGPGGGGNDNANVGAGYRLLKPGDQAIKTLFPGYGILIDSSSNTNALTFKADTTGSNGLVTRSELRDSSDKITQVRKPSIVYPGDNHSISDTLSTLYDDVWITIDADSALTADTAQFSSYYIRRKDSATNAYVTPTRLNDTAAAIRQAFEGATAVEIPLPDYTLRAQGVLTTWNGLDAYPLVRLIPFAGTSAMIWPNDDSLRMHAYDSILPVSHPAIEYVHGGWNGFPYWMAYAPYPAEARENPSVEASYYGTIWRTPPGATNPVEPEPAGAPSNYNSDVDLVYRADESKMYLFWRYETGAGVSQHYWNESTNGVNWINKTLLIPSGAGASPTFLYRNNLWHMYDVDYTTNAATQDPFIIYYRFSPTLAGLKSARKYRCTISNTPAGKHIWHIQIRWNETLNQLVGLFNFTTINPGGAPNNGGVLAVAFSTDFTTFNVGEVLPIDINVYRSSLVETPAAIRQGAYAKVILNHQWNFRGDSTVLLFVKPNGAVPTFSNYDSYESSLGGIFGTRYRLSSFYGLPAAIVRRSSDDSTMHVYPDATNTDLTLKSGQTLTSWLGGADAYVARLYNQVKSKGDYLTFTGTGQPRLIKGIWHGTSSWGMRFDGTDDLGGAYQALGVRQVFVAGSLDTGRIYSRTNETLYGGLNGVNETQLRTTNISHHNDPWPMVRTYIFNGANSRIRNNGQLAAVGAVTNPTATGQFQLGAFYSGGSHTNYYKGEIAEVVYLNTDTASVQGLTDIENVLMSEYAYDPDSLLYDTYTAADGTNVTSHTANLGGSYTASDANWTITSNTLRRGAAGSGQPTAVLTANGHWNGIVEGSVTPGGSGGSGLVFRYYDNNNFYYVRVFGGTTLAVFKYVSGSPTSIATATVSAAGQWSARVVCWGNTIRVYLNGAATPAITTTDAAWSSFAGPAVGYGFHAATGDTPTSAIFDNLKFFPKTSY